MRESGDTLKVVEHLRCSRTLGVTPFGEIKQRTHSTRSRCRSRCGLRGSGEAREECAELEFLIELYEGVGIKVAAHKGFGSDVAQRHVGLDGYEELREEYLVGVVGNLALQRAF